ncbi:12030_t:CDS:2, partial [Racocetra persica]
RSEEEELESENSDNEDDHASSSRNSTRYGCSHPSKSHQGRARPYRLPESSETPLTNIRLEFLPPHTTAHLQPIDANIINSFKA